MQVQSKTLNSPKLPMGANRVSVFPDKTQCLLMLMGWLQQIHLEYLELKGTVMVQRIKFCSKKNT